jgi:hypothetical protein
MPTYISRIHVFLLALLPMLAVSCARLTRPNSDGSNVLLSFPGQLRPGEQIVEFELNIRNGAILTVNKVPYDWLLSTLVEAPGSQMSGTPNHGASSFADMTPLKRFLTVHKDRQPFEVTGSLVVTTNFADMKTNFFKNSDFILEWTAPNENSQEPVPVCSETIQMSLAACSCR